MSGRHSVSAAVRDIPQRFDTYGLLTHASELLRDRTTNPSAEPLGEPLLRFYIERGLVEGPETEGSRQIFHQRQLLQLCAVQVLRSADLDLERIAQLVHGVDEDHLRMLCDEPEEAAKKAAVMRNWMQMMDKGRYSRDERGETAMANRPKAEPIAPRPAPLPPARTAARPAPAIPDLQLGVAGYGAALANGVGEALADVDDLGLPDAVPMQMTPGRPQGRGGPGSRRERETLAVGDLQSLMDASGDAPGAVDGATVGQTQAVVTQARLAGTDGEAALAKQVAPPPPPTPPPPQQYRRSPPQQQQSQPPPPPARPAEGASAVEFVPASQDQPARRNASRAQGRVWRRHNLAPGLELHVEEGSPARPRDEASLQAICDRLREILGS